MVSLDPMTGQIARLKVTLTDFEPKVWRRIEVPADAPLTLVHEAIQAAMLFLNYHLFAFEAGRRGQITSYRIPDPYGGLDEVRDVRRERLSSKFDHLNKFCHTCPRLSGG